MRRHSMLAQYGVKSVSADGAMVAVPNALRCCARGLTITGSSVQNVGDLVTAGEHAGKYAVPVTVRGKNWSDIPDIDIDAYLRNVTLDEIHKAQFARLVGKQITFSWSYSSNGQTETSSSNTIRLYNDGVRGDIVVAGQPFVLSDSVTIMRYHCASDNTEGYFRNIQVEIGNAATAYEPYVEPVTTTVYLDAPLRQGDALDVVSGKLTRYDQANPTYIGKHNIPAFKGTTVFDVGTATPPSAITAQCVVARKDGN